MSSSEGGLDVSRYILGEKLRPFAFQVLQVYALKTSYFHIHSRSDKSV